MTAAIILDRDRRNVLVLATCQMLFGSARSLLNATAPLIAYGLATNKGLATLPTALVIIGTALSTIPASLFMRRVGRRAGFLVGTSIGGVAGAVCAVALVQRDLWLFCFGAFLFGSCSGFSQLYRFAAADAASADFKSKAISLVLAGGVFAGFAGPEMAKFGQTLIAQTEFLGAYLFLIGAMAAAACVLVFLDIPPLTPKERADKGRPIGEIMRQPVFIAATLSAMIAQAVMNFLMTATPIAMMHAHHNFSDTALVIEWHIVGMFAPGFVTGSLIKRFGEVRMIYAGLALQLACVMIAMSGDTVLLFWASLTLLGVGWNFAFTASTSLLTEAHTPSERNKTQGAANFCIYGVVAFGALSSGALIHYFGWQWVNVGTLPLLAVSALAMTWYAGVRRAAAGAQPS